MKECHRIGLILWLSVTSTLALTGSHCHSLALSGSLLLPNFAYTALDRLTGPLISSHRRCHDDTLHPTPVLHRILQTGSCKPFYITFWFDKQMLEKVFYSNTAPSLGFVNHLFYKIEYMGRSCLNQVWALAFDWGALTTWNKHSWNAFWKLARFWLYNRYQAQTPGTFISMC